MKRLVPPFLALALLLAVTFPGGVNASPTERTWLPCNPTSDLVTIRVKPRACAILPPQASFVEGVNLGKLRWKHWGKHRAYYRGISKGFHLPLGETRVKGFAFRARPDLCGGRKQLFTRLLVRWRYGGKWRKRIVKTQSCVGFD